MEINKSGAGARSVGQIMAMPPCWRRSPSQGKLSREHIPFQIAYTHYVPVTNRIFKAIQVNNRVKKPMMNRAKHQREN
jgi:hypothetical protein